MVVSDPVQQVGPQRLVVLARRNPPLLFLEPDDRPLPFQPLQRAADLLRPGPAQHLELTGAHARHPRLADLGQARLVELTAVQLLQVAEDGRVEPTGRIGAGIEHLASADRVVGGEVTDDEPVPAHGHHRIFDSELDKSLASRCDLIGVV